MRSNWWLISRHTSLRNCNIYNDFDIIYIFAHVLISNDFCCEQISVKLVIIFSLLFKLCNLCWFLKNYIYLIQTIRKISLVIINKQIHVIMRYILSDNLKISSWYVRIISFNYNLVRQQIALNTLTTKCWKWIFSIYFDNFK